MNLQEKIALLDSLERMNIELEIEKLIDGKREVEFKSKVQAVLNNPSIKAVELIELFDKRYIKKNPNPKGADQ